MTQEWLARDARELFEAEELLDHEDAPIGVAADLAAQGFSTITLVRLEGWNRQAAALQRLAGLLGLNLYMAPQAFFHQIGAISVANLKARELYARVQKELRDRVDAPVGHARVRREL